MLINANGIGIDFRDEGAGSPVIFLHAFPLNQTMWNDQLSALRNLYRTITIDLRGFGLSEAPSGSCSMDQMAADVRSVMSVLGVDRAVLVGGSMGGYVSLSFYRHYPGSVRALVLADTRATADAPDARVRRIKSAERAEREGARAIADDMVPLLLGRTTLESRPSVVDRVRAMIEGNSPSGIASAQRGMAERRDSTSLLAAIDFPALVMVGAEDSLTPVAEAESLCAGIGDSRLCVLEGSGHLPSMETPVAFNSALIEFLESIPIDEVA